MINIRPYIVLFIIVVTGWSCETRIDPNLPEAPEITFVDAWINNKPEPQVIRVKKTLPYFENQEFPGVSDADARS